MYTVQIGDLVDDQCEGSPSLACGRRSHDTSDLITKSITNGASAKIFSAVDIQLGVVVAIKLRDGDQSLAEREIRFLRDVRRRNPAGRM